MISTVDLTDLDLWAAGVPYHEFARLRRESPVAWFGEAPPTPDVGHLARWAVAAERAGIDGVMVSEHIALGPSASANGLPQNPRDYAPPGNQDPATPWPSPLVLLSAIAAATTRIRLVAGAIISPLRHPLALAKDLATLDRLSGVRLVVLPTVSWHRDEYDALGVPFALVWRFYRAPAAGAAAGEVRGGVQPARIAVGRGAGAALRRRVRAGPDRVRARHARGVSRA